MKVPWRAGEQGGVEVGGVMVTIGGPVNRVKLRMGECDRAVVFTDGRHHPYCNPNNHAGIAR